MKVVIAGGSGQLGRILPWYFEARGSAVAILASGRGSGGARLLVLMRILGRWREAS